jgi:hypothetical protein
VQRELLEGLLRRCVVALRKQGQFDAANTGEEWISAWRAGFFHDPHGQVEAMAAWNAELERAHRVDSLGDRVRLKLQPERAFNLDLEDHIGIKVVDPHVNGEWELRLAPERHAERSRALVLESRAFLDQPTAELAATRLEAALLLASVRLGYGFALTERTPPGVITNSGFALLVPIGMQGLKDELGITLFRTPPPAIFLGTGGFRATVTVRHTRMIAELQQALTDAVVLDERTRTAYELFASSRFENSSRSRFLLLVMAVEALVERSGRPQDEQGYLDEAIRALKTSALSVAARATMTQALSSLKAQSISSAAQAMIAGAISTPAAEAFKKLYGIRSRLVHGGLAISPGNLNDASNQLEPTVKALLLARLSRSP